MNDNGKEQQAKSVLIIEFNAPSSSEFKIRTENVTPAQILGAAAWLDWFARKTFDAAAQVPARPDLIVPKFVGLKPNN